MPDTFKITVPGEAFTITDPSKFKPAALHLEERFPTVGHPLIFKQNPTKEQLRREGYTGSLTIMKYVTTGGLRTELQIQASAPKLHYQNNLGEAVGFADLCSTVVSMLARMGIETYPDAIAAARTTRIDYGKNFILPAGLTSVRAIEALHRARKPERWSTTLTDYPNGGLGVSHSTKQRRLEVYDKRAEIGGAGPYRSPGAPGSYQNLIAPVDAAFPQILRFEYQLKTPKQIRLVLEEIGAEPDLSFAALFNDGIERLLVETQLEAWLSSVPAGLDGQTPSEIAEELRFKTPSLSPTEVMSQASYIHLVREKGVKQSRRWLQAMGMTANQIERREKTLLPFACGGVREAVLEAVGEQLREWPPITPETHPELFCEKVASGSRSGLGRD